MFRKRKIGVLGTMNSGKTVLLTSLLWHLNEFSPDKFHVGKQENVEIKDVNLDDKLGDRGFNYNAYTNMFVTQGGWPAKTQDFAIARCVYSRSDSYWERDVTFVDIPGERVSDVLIWKTNDYADWSRQIERFWSGDASIQRGMDSFIECRKKIEEATLADSDSWNMLVNEYRNGLIALAGNNSPFISPSTFVLTTDGKTMDGLSQEEILQRPIWSEGDFFPLPEQWMKSQNKVLKNLYAKCKENFKRYRKGVLKPLYEEIDDCDSFIVCVDVFNILVSGLSRFYQVKGEISNFFQMIRPGKFGEMMISTQKAMNFIKLGHLLPNFMQAKPPKIAYIATKSDMAIPSAGKNRLHKLLQELVRNVNNSSYVNSKLFTCCAGKTFEYDSDSGFIVYFSTKGEVHVALDKWPELPNSWEKWDPVKYRGFLRGGLPMQLVAGSPPEQDNLDKLFDFITEDDE